MLGTDTTASRAPSPWRRIKRAADTASCCTTEATLPEPRTWLEAAGTEPLAGALCASVAGTPAKTLSDRAPVPANTEVACSTSPEAAQTVSVRSTVPSPEATLPEPCTWLGVASTKPPNRSLVRPVAQCWTPTQLPLEHPPLGGASRDQQTPLPVAPLKQPFPSHARGWKRLAPSSEL